MEVNYQQNSYLTVIGVHLTMHLMHPKYCQITIMYFFCSLTTLMILLLTSSTLYSQMSLPSAHREGKSTLRTLLKVMHNIY